MFFRLTLQAVLATAAATAKFDNEKTKNNPFVPQKLIKKYDNLPSNDYPKDSIQTLKAVNDHLKLQKNAAAEAQMLKNPSSYDEAEIDASSTDEILDDIASIDEPFDPSDELGIFATSTNEVYTEEQRKLANDVECDGNHPVVNPLFNFRNLIIRCTDPRYQDNCPFNPSLPLDCWDTSQVTDMSYAFYRMADFNQALSSWDVSSVTDFSDMFGFAASFDQPLDSWDMSSAVDVSDMFWGAHAFNQPLDSWDTSSVQNMDYMFLDARSFNQPLDAWNTDYVTDMKYMFAFTESFDQPLNSWSTDLVTDMHGMFAFGIFDQPLSSWNVESVTRMSSMFHGAERFNQNLDCFNTRSVQDMTYMFTDATDFNQCLSTWAYKSPTALTGPQIFNNTGCPIQGIPDAITGPWCQGADDQCYASDSAYGQCDPSSAANSNHWTSAMLFGAVLASDMIVSFLF